jgi:hypothetical protein
MTLGLSNSGAIKIKTDEAGGGLRAVECACCSPCYCNTPTKQYQITASWASSTGDSFPCWFDSGLLIAAYTSDGYTISAVGRCEASLNYPAVDGDKTINRWDLAAQNFSAPYGCSYLIGQIDGPDPVGTFYLYGATCESYYDENWQLICNDPLCNSDCVNVTCGDWYLTISEIPSTP